MTYATTTPTWVVIVPSRELVVHHTVRCLYYHGRRITESPVLAPVVYRATVPVLLHVVLISEQEPMYMDMNGWMFDEAVMERLLREKRLRYADARDWQP